MKIITNSKQQDTIHVDELTNKHVIVGINSIKQPLIVIKETTGTYIMVDLRNPIDGALYNRPSTLKELIISSGDTNFAAFHQSDWKQALQWLIDNA